MGGVDEEMAREAMRLASHKLPISTRFVSAEAGVSAGSESMRKEA
jgi:large subunit ribosomal protein L16